MESLKTITLGEIRQELLGLLARPDETRIFLGVGDLTWYRLKDRGPVEGPGLVQLEFNELYSVTLDPTRP